MVKRTQHLAGARCQVKLKMWSFYTWLILCGFTGEMICSDTAKGKLNEAQTISTLSSNGEASEAQSSTEESTLEALKDQKLDYSDLYRFSRAVPRTKVVSESSSERKSKDESKQDYVLKIPLSLLRQYELYRLLRLQEEGIENYDKRQTVIPVPRVGRSNYENEYNMEDSDNVFLLSSFDNDNFNEGFLDEIFKVSAQDILPNIRSRRSMLLLSTPKSEETTKEKPTQTFVLPYPRPGRSNKHTNMEKRKNSQLILPYPRPGRSKIQKQLSEMFTANTNNKKYILPTARLRRATSDSMFGKEEDSMVMDDWFSSVKSNPVSQKLNKENLSVNNMDENDGSSFFVIPYPRPGKKSIFKLKKENQKSKNSEKEIADYVLPYPRPGKKSAGENSAEFFSSKSNAIENIGSHTLKLPYSRPGNIHDNYFYTQDIYDFSDDFNRNQNMDADNIIDVESKEITPVEEFEDLFVTPNKKISSSYSRTDRSFDNIVPYPRPGRSRSHENEASHLLSNDMEFNVFQTSQTDFTNSDDLSSNIFRFKRSSSVVPYPRLGRSNSVVPYPRPGRSNVVPYPRPGRSNSVVPYPRLGRSNSVVPYPRLGRSNSVVPYPRLGRSDAIVPYPHFGRSKRVSSVVPYPRLGRSNSVVPYPRIGRGESVVPYPRPGRSDSVVPYPRLGRSDSVVPYPRPGRSDSVVPYPRPGRAESVVPYPRPGRSDSVVPYPRLGRSQVSKLPLINKYTKSDSWLLPNIRPGRSITKPEETINNYEINSRSERSVDEDDFGNIDINSNSNSFNRNGRTINGQGYVLPRPRIGRSIFQERKKRESFDTDTVIPYPRLGRSEKEIVPVKYSPQAQNSVHKLNKHVLPNVEDSVYLLPYPRPGRDMK